MRVVAPSRTDWCNDRKYSLDDKRHLSTCFDDDELTVIAIMARQINPAHVIDARISMD
jgi:hypothetical protein